MRQTAVATAPISRTAKHAGHGTTRKQASTYTQVSSCNGKIAVKKVFVKIKNGTILAYVKKKY